MSPAAVFVAVWAGLLLACAAIDYAVVSLVLEVAR